MTASSKVPLTMSHESKDTKYYRAKQSSAINSKYQEGKYERSVYPHVKEIARNLSGEIYLR